MSFLLDTNILSETTRPQPHPGVLTWFAAQSPDSLFLSAITIGELQRGALLLTDGKRRKALQLWIEAEIKAAFAQRILALDTEVLEQWARLSSPPSALVAACPSLIACSPPLPRPIALPL